LGSIKPVQGIFLAPVLFFHQFATKLSQIISIMKALHALLANDWDQAKTIYAEYLKNEADPAAAKAVLLKDLDDLETAGLTSPAVAQARKWLTE